MKRPAATHASRFVSNPTGPFLTAVAALDGLCERSAGAAFAHATHDDGAAFMRDTGLTRGKLSERNVGKLLAGIPAGLLAEAEADLEPGLLDMDDPVQRRGFESHRRLFAAERRQAIIEDLAHRRGFMDHGQLFLRDGEPHSIVGHPYRLEVEEISQAVRIVRLWGLKIQVHGRSWYYPGRSLTVLIYRPGGSDAGRHDQRRVFEDVQTLRGAESDGR